ncbi:MAG: ATP-binding protein, partial [Gammaproteobacteria bacterium]|nr:ATP-binding protein [Gammaproteobacteria bacterium]
MEIYNWGTFDNEIVKISPLGNNSLLTGANGSGKTTFIDALLTLLVPTKKDRFYNQSSGVVKKGDRNERSYVLGHYGDIQKEGDLSTTTQKLRDEQTVFSVLLATFKSDEEKIITLFQARNFSNGQLKVTFGLAHKTLSIAEDFSGFDAQGKWKKRLEERYNISKKVIEYFDGVNKYADRIANQFGMRSTKALSLFNQVVGIKVLGDLNEFIKTNMLEARDAEAKYIELRESFITLSSAKNNIDKAKEQIQQLESIDKIANQLSTIETELKQLQSDKEIAVYWFASQGIKVCDEENIRLDDLFETTKDKISSLNDTLDELSGKESDLKVQIESSDIGRQIKDLDEEIKRIEGQRDTKKGTLEEYNKLTKKLELTFDPDEATFIKNRDFSKEQKQVCIKELKEKNEDLGKARNSYGDIGKENKDAINIIEVLRKNDNNISGRVAEIRDEILLAIGAKKEEIPFIGELIKVEDEDTVWQSVIEKVLHNFALQLIVPDKYYQKVNQ